MEEEDDKTPLFVVDWLLAGKLAKCLRDNSTVPPMNLPAAVSKAYAWLMEPGDKRRRLLLTEGQHGYVIAIVDLARMHGIQESDLLAALART